MNRPAHRISLARSWRRIPPVDPANPSRGSIYLGRVFHAPRGTTPPSAIRLVFGPGPWRARILLNDTEVASCKMDVRLDIDITDSIQPTNRLSVELIGAADDAPCVTEFQHPNDLLPPPFDVWLEIFDS